MDRGQIFEKQLAEMRQENLDLKGQLERATIEAAKSHSKIETLEARNLTLENALNVGI